MLYQQYSIYLGYIMTIGDSQNLIAPFTIVREMCPDPSVKCKNLIFGYFQESNNGSLLSAKNRDFTFYTIVRTHFPSDCEQCYEVLGVTNGHYISQIDGKLLVECI